MGQDVRKHKTRAAQIAIEGIVLDLLDFSTLFVRNYCPDLHKHS